MKNANANRMLGFALGLAVVLAAACASSTPETIIPVTPSRASFAPVAQALVHGCGTLDCHGSAFRNLRLYGNEGLRIDPAHRPLVPACTTSLEVDRDFDALVGLEPEAMTSVVAAGGVSPEGLLFVRKARGVEHHKAGAIVVPGDDLDVCLTSWLTGKTNVDACTRAAPPTFPITTPPACETGP